MKRTGREWDEIREVKITRDFLPNAAGSVLIEMGKTRVLCTATLENSVPGFLRDLGKGWLTAEYAMLPMSTPDRITRESVRGRVGGRTHEIQRLIGRSLRTVTNREVLGERTVYIDCDVIQADGGTRTASITGSFIALVDAFRKMNEEHIVDVFPIDDYIAAISVGLVGDSVLLDLDYLEDSSAEVDMNIVMTGGGNLVEIQGTAEGDPFSRDLLDQMIDVATKGIGDLIEKQREILGELS
jgi:ribonuclease PH